MARGKPKDLQNEVRKLLTQLVNAEPGGFLTASFGTDSLELARIHRRRASGQCAGRARPAEWVSGLPKPKTPAPLDGPRRHCPALQAATRPAAPGPGRP